jgi:hypothetical protein
MSPMKISTVLDSIDLGTVALPEFQRGYVWRRNQVRDLMQSLYARYPVGGLLVWSTEAQTVATKGGSASMGVVDLLLDGQQRMTSLYGIVRGHPPLFFQGDAAAFTNLYFNVSAETFEFYGPVKMRSDPLWMDVTKLYKEGLAPQIHKLAALGLAPDEHAAYLDRLVRLLGICDIEVHVDKITGSDKDVDVVVDIFNRVNSGGTKLSKGDLALARICATLPEARAEMNAQLARWREHGFDFNLDWLLRVITALLKGSSLFTSLRGVSAEEFQGGLKEATKRIDQLLNLIGSRLGLDHDRVLGGRYAFPVMARFLSKQQGTFPDAATEGKLLYWYVHAFLWGRHTGSTESVLAQDLAALDRGGLDELVALLRSSRGDLVIRADNFTGSGVGSRFYPLLYMLTRVHGARDLGSGVTISAALLGKSSTLHLHHIFPKGLLAEAGKDRQQRNAVANFCFLTQSANLSIGMKHPADYLPQVEAAHRGVLASQWIPEDAALRSIDHYDEFLMARRELLAQAANDFLDSLLEGHVPAEEVGEVVVRPPLDPVAAEIVDLMGRLGLAAPELDRELLDEHSEEVLAVADMAWPDGVQQGLSEPLAFLLEPDPEMEHRLGELGYRFFTELPRLYWYLEELLEVDIDEDGHVGERGA